jgi:hypothetical protein
MKKTKRSLFSFAAKVGFAAFGADAIIDALPADAADLSDLASLSDVHSVVAELPAVHDVVALDVSHIHDVVNISDVHPMADIAAVDPSDITPDHLDAAADHAAAETHADEVRPIKEADGRWHYYDKADATETQDAGTNADEVRPVKEADGRWHYYDQADDAQTHDAGTNADEVRPIKTAAGQTINVDAADAFHAAADTFGGAPDPDAVASPDITQAPKAFSLFGQKSVDTVGLGNTRDGFTLVDLNDKATLDDFGYGDTPLPSGTNASGVYGGPPPTDIHGNGAQDGQGNNPYRNIHGNTPTGVQGNPWYTM